MGLFGSPQYMELFAEELRFYETHPLSQRIEDQGQARRPVLAIVPDVERHHCQVPRSGGRCGGASGEGQGGEGGEQCATIQHGPIHQSRGQER